MTSTKYIGYVGGVAVAVGVGAAIAAAGQGTAHAESTDSGSKDTTSSSSSKPNTGPKKPAANAGAKTDSKSDSESDSKSDSKPDRPKPLSKLNDNLEKAGEKLNEQVTKTVSTVSKTISDSLAKPATKPATKPAAKPSAEEFEAEQVAKLKNLFTPKQAAAPKPDTSVETEPVAEPTSSTVVSSPKVAAAVETQADTAADTPWSPNPFRPDDPEPTDIPDEIMELRNALMNLTPEALDAFDPFIREATEQIYRGSQIVPWVNAVIPISKILPALAPGLGSGPEGDRARQLIINELIKTTPIGSFAYYGYDIAADLLNLEDPAAVLKDQAVATVWDILDPFELAHVKGESGIGNAAGS
ncbi:hypothetical protein H7J87_24725 [Mycolicibacterium wolinskyi]|uniref:Uncharacterized protein n=1 Tax=Mycolicibacterium wolinskyi TaxID=59750 RepID=A0A1X2EZY8_9MYCO|nr:MULTISPECIES: hypothetical protein [Mycolicibacterium]MCV7288535.1 hypothetical protein [Mycolicibacterium wolinskyi]MCV7295757.1 hypothetical protein [Mycolicibacterium goodii]ORX11762.1 hypothetical protein AWC31_34435 [Mycolicibacterium wolinskyi]